MPSASSTSAARNRGRSLKGAIGRPDGIICVTGKTVAVRQFAEILYCYHRAVGFAEVCCAEGNRSGPKCLERVVGANVHDRGVARRDHQSINHRAVIGLQQKVSEIRISRQYNRGNHARVGRVGRRLDGD